MKVFLTITMILLLVFLVVPGENQENTAEKAQENPWHVPLFALDKPGNPITDLKETDIQLHLDSEPIKTFKMVKQSLDAAPNLTVFLLFDTAMSGKESTEKAKEIAHEIVTAAKPGTRFVLLNIKPFKGLTFIGEGTSGTSGINDMDNKDQLQEMIREKIKALRKRKFKPVDEIGTLRIPHAYSTEKKLNGLISTAAQFHQRETMSFIKSFQTLYLFLNAIRDKKMIYFFTEGTYQSIRKYIPAGTAMYHHYLNGMGKDLGRCGAVLFIINPTSNLTGEYTLQSLLNESGGTYLEGSDQKTIKNMHHACYEISLPDIPSLKGRIHEIMITAKRYGVTLFFPRILEKPKQYFQMTAAEKELLALNLVTQPQHPLIRRKISAFNAKINKTKKSKNKVTYAITLPDSFLNKTMDIYKLWMTNDNEAAHMEKKSAVPQKNYVFIEFPLPDQDLNGCFVLVNGAMNSARVYGKEIYDQDTEITAMSEKAEKEILAKMQEIEASVTREMMRKGIKKTVIQPTAAGQTKPTQETTEPVIFTGPLKEILAGAANYCEKLKKSDFHFLCQEKVYINHKPLTDAEDYQSFTSYRDAQKGTYSQLDEIRQKVYTRMQSYVFNYQLNKQGLEINEKRTLIASKDNEKVDQEKVIRADAYFARRLVLVPLLFLDRAQWGKYDFHLKGYEKWKSRKAAVVEVTPRETTKTTTIYGKLWIDTEDFSLVRIEANPRSIPGYTQFNELAAKLQTKLYLSLETEFAEIHDGIRFPTKVHMLEKYKGGRYIRQHRGSKGWERSRMIFTYTDYQFPESIASEVN
ncbi:MAG: hypothetical protein JSV88_29170 [Candidatus Aminicenantes bacterium]|nr:MAG: hypothetical protein JSV88_29170 [Candidatus Aminicenantes bacterium]